MSDDIEENTLLSSLTLTAGTATSAHQHDNMDSLYIQLRVSNGLFTSATYAWLESSIDGTTTTYAAITDSTTTVTGTATAYAWNYNNPAFNYVRVNFTIPSGNIVAEVKSRSRGER